MIIPENPAPPPRPRTICLTLEYDGTAFGGWQRQTNVRSVQQVVEDALSKHLGEQIRIKGSGRTDAGVHARGQVISFVTMSNMPLTGILHGTNHHLPDDVVVRQAALAPNGFDARRSAIRRTYRFHLVRREVRPAIGRQHVTHISPAVQIAPMKRAASLLVGDHDFRAFRSSACIARRTQLDLEAVDLFEEDEERLTLTLRCRSFLHNMVRIVGGTLVAVGLGQMTDDDVITMLQTGIRNPLARTLRPHGLVLWQVDYPPEIQFSELVHLA